MNLSFSKQAVLILVGAIVIYLLVIAISNSEKLFELLSKLKFEFLIIILGLQTLSFFLKSLRQKELFNFINIKISFKKNFILFLSGLSMLMTPGGIGGAIKFQFLKNEFGFSRSKTLPIILHERYHDFLALVTLMIFFSIYSYSLLTNTIITISAILIMITFLLLRHQNILSKFLLKIQYFPLLNKIPNNYHDSITSLNTLTSNRPFFVSWGISLIAVLFDLIAVYFIFVSLGIDLNFFETSQGFLTSISLGLFSFIPGGLGITEVSFLTILLSHGLEIYAASAAVLAVRLLTLWFSTIVGFISMKFIKL